MTVTGETLYENVKECPVISKKQDVVLPKYKPFKSESHIKILKGNLAPEGCVSKISSDKGRNIIKKAIVFNSEDEMMKSLKNHEIKKDNFVILRYQGESTGCPEMLKPTSALVGYFGDEVPPLATDGRFSGGSHGILICHLPDAFKEDSITSVIKNDDVIILDLDKNSITLNVEEEDLNNRLKSVIKPKLDIEIGYLSKFNRLVGGIDSGYSTY